MDDFWSKVDAKDIVEIDKLIDDILTYSKADTEFALKTGVEIAKWKDKLKHGDFLKSLGAKAGIHKRKAQRWMRASIAFKGNFEKAALLPRQAVYSLSAEGAWVDEVRNEILKNLTPNAVPTAEEVKKACNKARAKSYKESGKGGSGVTPPVDPIVKGKVDTLLPLLEPQGQLVIQILSGEDWSKVRKELIKLLSKPKQNT